MKLISKWLIYLVVCLVLVQSTKANSQSINALTFGNSSISQAGIGGTKLQNGDILIAGYAQNLPGTSDFSISKLSPNGQFKWTNYSGTSNNDLSSMMDFDGQDRVYMCGTTYISQNFNSGLVICFDTSGNTIWQQSYSLPNSSISLTGIERTNSGLILVGNYSDPANIGNDIIMIMTDSIGSIQHYHIYGDPTVNEIASGMKMIGDSIALIACDKFVGTAGYNASVLACDTSGLQLWETTLTSRFNSGSKNLLIDQFNNIIVVGETETDSSFQFDIQISKLDLLGNLIWIKTIIGSNNSDAGFAVCNSSNGNYVLTGFYFDTTANSKKIMLLETDTAGSMIQMQLYGSSLAGIGMSIESFANSYLIVGSDLTNGLYQVIFDSLNSSTSIFEANFASEFYIYPNPFKNKFEIKSTTKLAYEIVGIELFDIIGNKLFSFKSDSKTYEIPENIAPGLLMVRINFLDAPPITKQIVLLK